MDGQQFDELARALGGTTSRRGALKLLAAGALAGILGGTARPTAAAACPPLLQSQKECRNKARAAFERHREGCLTVYEDCLTSPHTNPGVCGAVLAHCDQDAKGEFRAAQQACKEIGVDCDPSQTCCDEGCVYTPTDPANCGACGVACAAGESCCVGECADTQSSTQHCGACFNRCAAYQTCQNGVCTGCESGLTDCGGTCVNTRSDAANCGACGVACASHQTCQNGLCTGCESGLTDCGGTCIDTSNSKQHCGGCFQSCSSGQICAAGQCQEASQCIVDRERCYGVYSMPGYEGVNATGQCCNGDCCLMNETYCVAGDENGPFCCPSDRSCSSSAAETGCCPEGTFCAGGRCCPDALRGYSVCGSEECSCFRCDLPYYQGGLCYA